MVHLDEENAIAALRPDDDLSNAVAVLARDCEGFIDLVDLPGVCKQRCKTLSMRVE